MTQKAVSSLWLVVAPVMAFLQGACALSLPGACTASFAHSQSQVNQVLVLGRTRHHGAHHLRVREAKLDQLKPDHLNYLHLSQHL